jgi:hypothetical protein
MSKDRQELERCLAVVDAYKASGHKASVWAPANGVSLGDLTSWCCHANRWRARLAGVPLEAKARAPTAGFVAAKVAALSPLAAVRVELPGTSVALALHWPLSHVRELAAWVREVSR